MRSTSLLLVFVFSIISPFLAFCRMKNDDIVGFWVSISTPEYWETLATPESRYFITLTDIQSLAHHTIHLPDHKTKKMIAWEGVYLRPVLQKIANFDWDKIHRLVIKAPDGYSSVISGSRIIKAENALCAFRRKDSKNWLAKYGDMRIIFPDLHEMHWINNPAEVEIELVENCMLSNNWRFYFFDSPAFEPLRVSESDPYLSEILTQIGCADRDFTIFTHDGHLRQYLFDSTAQKIKIVTDTTGLWAVRGLGVPIGFRLKKIFFVSSENVGLFPRALSLMEKQLWHELFSAINPLMGENFQIAKIILELTSGEKIVSGKLDDYLSAKLSLYDLLESAKKEQKNLMGIEILWSR
ncbi:MAG TPA: hypothetical protein ENN22_09840 [bacterium]|nr:hypothetical protein [bacterium]